MRLTKMMGRVALAGLLAGVLSPLSAMDVREISWDGGTPLTLNTGATGHVDDSSGTALLLRFGTAAAVQEIRIPYEKMMKVEYTDEKAHRLGVLPAIVAGIFAARIHKRTFSINYADEAGVVQVVRFDVGAETPGALLAVLKARAPQACGDCSLRVK